MTMVLRQFVGGGATGRLPVSPCDARVGTLVSCQLPSTQKHHEKKTFLLGPRRRSLKALCVCSAETANSRPLYNNMSARSEQDLFISSRPLDLHRTDVQPSGLGTGPMDEEGQRQGGSQVAPKTLRDSLMSVPAHVAAAQNSHPSPVATVSDRYRGLIVDFRAPARHLQSRATVAPHSSNHCPEAACHYSTHIIAIGTEGKKMTFIVRDVFPSSLLVSRSIISQPKTDRLNSYSQDGQPYARATKHP